MLRALLILSPPALHRCHALTSSAAARCCCLGAGAVISPRCGAGEPALRPVSQAARAQGAPAAELGSSMSCRSWRLTPTQPRQRLLACWPLAAWLCLHACAAAGAAGAAVIAHTMGRDGAHRRLAASSMALTCSVVLCWMVLCWMLRTKIYRQLFDVFACVFACPPLQVRDWYVESVPGAAGF